MEAHDKRKLYQNTHKKSIRTKEDEAKITRASTLCNGKHKRKQNSEQAHSACETGNQLF